MTSTVFRSWREILNPRNPLTKLTKASLSRPSVSIVSPSEEIQKSKSEPSDAQITLAMRLLNLAGCRILNACRIGVWSDLDCPEVRDALRTVGMDAATIIHLDEVKDIPMRFKVRSCPDRAAGESFAAWFRRAELEHFHLGRLSS
jgi:hypothetical protein